LRRRTFLKNAGATAAALLIPQHVLAEEPVRDGENLTFASLSMELQLSAVAPEILSLNLDGLGHANAALTSSIRRVPVLDI
jgi:hypothetical protein